MKSYSWNIILPTILAVIFFAHVLSTIICNPIMFFKRHGRRHTTSGFFYLAWLILGYIDVLYENPILERMFYDIILGIMGIILTLTAATDFQHKNVKNFASGTLDQHATVTNSEMIEHSFYQGLNLVQILYLHSINWRMPLYARIVLLLLVTSPWLLREYFPVNKFSDNYKEVDAKSTTLIRILYRIKKYQYVFYKHFLLHGLNLCVALNGYSFSKKQYFRLYWMLLNTSYVMEFFLQTLVKKKYMTQISMLFLQKVLMLASTVAAIYVLQHVNFIYCFVSVVLNFINRKHDLFNTIVLVFGLLSIDHFFSR